MDDRIEAELELILQRFPAAEYRAEGRWLRIPQYPLPPGWNRAETDVACQIPAAYPGTPPYGIYVPSGIAFDGTGPANYQDRADNQPPFGGEWGVFSWQPMDNEWRATTNIHEGSNLMNWVLGFAGRFREGR